MALSIHGNSIDYILLWQQRAEFCSNINRRPESKWSCPYMVILLCWLEYQLWYCLRNTTTKSLRGNIRGKAPRWLTAQQLQHTLPWIHLQPGRLIRWHFKQLHGRGGVSTCTLYGELVVRKWRVEDGYTGRSTKVTSVSPIIKRDIWVFPYITDELQELVVSGLSSWN